MDGGELACAIFIQVEVEMAYFFQVGLRTASGVVLERVQADVDIGTMRILVAEPSLELGTGDPLRGAHALDGFPALSIAHDDGKLVRRLEVLVEVLPDRCLGGFSSLIWVTRRLQAGPVRSRLRCSGSVCGVAFGERCR